MQIVAMNCPHCGAPVSIDDRECAYCNSPIVITSFSTIGGINPAELNKYVSTYQKVLAEVPNDKSINLSVAFCYLRLRMYEQALFYFEMAIQDSFANSEAFFYAAVCLLGGKKAFLIQRNIIDKIETYINAARAIENKGIYAYFHAYIKYDYFERKFLMTQPKYDELLKEAYRLEVSDFDIKSDRIARERMTNIKSRALNRLGLDADEVKEVPPIVVSGYDFSRQNIKAWIGKDGKPRSNFYKAVVIFFSQNEMHIYTSTFSLDDTTEMEGTDVYFYQDIVSVSTAPNNIHVDGKDKNNGIDIQTIAFRLVTKGGTSVTVDMFNNYNVGRSVNAMRALLRERKERPVVIGKPQPVAAAYPARKVQPSVPAQKRYEPF